MKQESRSGGFSLIELMVAMTLSLFLIGGVILLFTATSTVANDTTQLARLQENLRFATDFLVRDIRNAGFSDQMTLINGEEADILDRYAEVDQDNNRLTIRYAGRGHCAQNFEDYRAVQNQYFVSNGELKCTGTDLTAATPTDPTERTVTLLTGVSAIEFEILLADNNPAPSGFCQIDPVVPSTNPCVLVKVTLSLLGLEDFGGGGNPSVELRAAIRNSALQLLYGGV